MPRNFFIRCLAKLIFISSMSIFHQNNVKIEAKSMTSLRFSPFCHHKILNPTPDD